jgi:hypothetical protein
VRLPSYCDLDLTIDNIPDLLVRMRMLVDPGTCLNSVVGERHVLRMEETPLPAFPRLFYAEITYRDERHNLTVWVVIPCLDIILNIADTFGFVLSSRTLCDNPVAHPAVNQTANQISRVKFVWEAQLNPAGFIKRL